MIKKIVLILCLFTFVIQATEIEHVVILVNNNVFNTKRTILKYVVENILSQGIDNRVFNEGWVYIAEKTNTNNLWRACWVTQNQLPARVTTAKINTLTNLVNASKNFRIFITTEPVWTVLLRDFVIVNRTNELSVIP